MLLRRRWVRGESLDQIVRSPCDRLVEQDQSANAGGVLVWMVGLEMVVLAVWQLYVAVTVHDGWWSGLAAAATVVTYGLSASSR